MAADEVPHQRKSGKGVGVGAVHLVYDQELLWSSDKNGAALRKAEEVVLTAMHEFSQQVWSCHSSQPLQRY